MKFSLLGLVATWFFASGSAMASTEATIEATNQQCANGRYGLICERGIVRYAYNEAVGTVTYVDPRRGLADVSWNIVGGGYGQNLSVDTLIPRNGGGGGGGNYNCIRIANNNRGCVGDRVGYVQNQAVGTIRRVNPSANTADVIWNIVGSGVGRDIPGHRLYRR